jgi:signal transduction histidine kinase
MSLNKKTRTIIQPEERPGTFRNIAVGALLFLLIGVILGVHLTVLHRALAIPLLFIIPVVLAAWAFQAKTAIVYAAVTLAALTFHAWFDQIVWWSWAIDFITVGMTAVLGITVAEEGRIQRRLAAQNALIAAEQSAEARRMGVLTEASRLFTSSLELRAVLQAVVEKITIELGDLSALFMFDEASVDLRLEALFTRDPGLRSRAEQLLRRVPVELGVTGTVARTSKSVLIPDVKSAILPAPMMVFNLALNVTSILSVPLLVRNRVIGVLTIASMAVGRHFSEDDTVLAEELAALAASSIENARLYAQQESLLNELQESRQEREQFLGMITHEIAGILTVLSGYAQLAVKTQKKTGQVNEKAMQAIQSQTQRLIRLVHDLQDISRIERGKFDIKRGSCDLVKASRQVADEQQSLTKFHTLVVDSEEPEISGFWDCDRLTQAISNIIGNAVKYSPDGGEVRITIRRVEDTAQVSVSDHGVGIAEQDMKRLFKPYSRLERTKHIKGSGLGLFISKAIVEAHKGRSAVESKIGEGTTFTVTLPLGEGQEAEAKGKETE